jgi:hypothetical protein
MGEMKSASLLTVSKNQQITELAKIIFFSSMLLIRDVYPGSRIQRSRRLEYRIPDPDLEN